MAGSVNDGEFMHEEPDTWEEVKDELRQKQSLTSVLNSTTTASSQNAAPSISSLGATAQGLAGGSISWLKASKEVENGFGDLWETIRESVEEMGEKQKEQQEPKGVDPLLGQVPEESDFQEYLKTIEKVWPSFARTHLKKPNGDSAVPLAQDETDSSSVAYRTIPQMYFQSDFKVEQHQIFKQSLHVSVSKQAQLNEELTAHLDTIEQALFEHIQRGQKMHLFESISKLSEPLLEDCMGMLSAAGVTRQKLKMLKKQQLRNGQVVCKLARRQRRAQEVLERLELLVHVQQSQPSIQMLLRAQDYTTALDLVEGTSAALDMKLAGLVSVKPVSRQLQDLTSTLDRMVEEDFVKCASDAILLCSKEVGSVTERREHPNDVDVEFPDQPLTKLCNFLLRRDLLKATLSSSLRDTLHAQFKKTLKLRTKELLSVLATYGKDVDKSAPQEVDIEDEGGVAASATADGNQDQSGSGEPAAAQGIGASLSGLPFENFLLFWQRIMEMCLRAAKSLIRFTFIVQEVSQSLNKDEGSKKDPEVAWELLRLFDVVQNSLLQKVSVLLNARQGEHQKLNVSNWQMLLQFSNETLERVWALRESCGKSLDCVGGVDVGSNLRTVLYSQTKAVIEEFHQQRVTKLTFVLESEKWDRTDVPLQYKQLIGKLIGEEAAQPKNGEEEADAERYLHVDGANFLVVPAVLILLQDLKEYAQLCADLPSVAVECVQRMCHLCKLFNRQTSELILGGQAVQKKTLAKINATNLALCSQSCGLVSVVLPKLQTQITARMQETAKGASATSAPSAGAALIGELSHIASEFNDLRSAVFSKLSDILSETYEARARTWFSTPHAEATGAPSALQPGTGALDISGLQAHEAMKNFAKDVTSMYRVLLKSLGGESVRKIFAEAFTTIAAQFAQRLNASASASGPPYEDQVGRSLGDRLAVDIAYLQDKLGSLNGIQTPVQVLLRDLARHLRNATKLQAADEPARCLNHEFLEALQRTGHVPQLD